ncbi:MAG: methyl-accepting chemotaxis protein [bacterium]|nr:methyl-accepting chemotaxis protein [bacterium]MDT8395959.1 methyl-accepting chemotaxis protein [bacterium]
MTRISNLTLKTKATSLIAVVLVLVIGSTTFIFSSEVNRKLESALMASTALVGENLVAEIKKTVDMGIYLSELEGLGGQLTMHVERNTNLGYIYVADEKASVLYISDGMPDWVRERARIPEAFAQDTRTPVVDKVNSGGLGFYQLSMAIESGGALQGYLAVGLKENVISEQLRQINRRLILIGLLGFLVATTVIIIFFNRIISQPLASLAGTARQISAGNIIEPEVSERGDEIGELSGAFTVMARELTGMIGRFSETSSSLQNSSVELTSVVKSLTASFGKQMETLGGVVTAIQEMDGLAQDLSRQAGTLSDTANESSAAITESTSAIGEINLNMAEINEAIENITSSILQMSATFGELAEGADETAKLGEESMDAVSRINEGVKNMEKMVDKSKGLAEDLRINAQDIGSKAVSQTLQGILSIKEDVQSSEQAMRLLNEKVDSIGEIVTVIEGIADQTNLLALNAAIISAQAGEEGKSFAVIASEIRELSASTTDSTKKISGLIRSVQEEAKSYTGYVKRVSKSVEEGHTRGLQATEALEKIVGSASESARMSGEISQVTREQAAASEMVSSSIEHFTKRADVIRRATSEEAQTAKFIRESIEKAKTMVEKVYKSTEEQNKTSQMINDMVIKAEEIAGKLQQATDREKDLSAHLASSVESLQEMGQENFGLVKNVDSSSEMLTGLSASLNKELGRFKVDSDRKVKPRKAGE